MNLPWGDIRDAQEEAGYFSRGEFNPPVDKYGRVGYGHPPVVELNEVPYEWAYLGGTVFDPEFGQDVPVEGWRVLNTDMTALVHVQVALDEKYQSQLEGEAADRLMGDATP